MMPTYADVLRELANKLDKDFHGNKLEVAKELKRLSDLLFIKCPKGRG